MTRRTANERQDSELERATLQAFEIILNVGRDKKTEVRVTLSDGTVSSVWFEGYPLFWEQA